MGQPSRRDRRRHALRPFGLLRSVAKRSRSEWPLVLAAWLLLACATSLITSAITYSESVTLGGFHKVIAASSPSASAVRVYASAPATEIPMADSAVRPIITQTLGADRGSISMIETTDGLSLGGYDASDQAHQIVVGSYAGIDSHARLIAGDWPAARPSGSTNPCASGSNGATGGAAGWPIETALSKPAADSLGLRLGDHVAFTSKLDSSHTFDACLAGIFVPDPSDRYWAGAALELSGTLMVGTSVTRGPFVVSPQALATVAGENNLTVEWRWLPEIGAIKPGDADALRKGIAGLKDRAQAAFPGRYVWQDTGLPAILAAATKSLLVAQSSSLLLFAQFVVLAVYAILLVAGMLVERRRPEAALLRSRGAAWPHLALLSLGEASLLAVPAVAVAPFVAQGVVRLVNVIGPLAGDNVVEPVGFDPAVLTAAALAGIGCVAVLTLPSLPGLGSLSGVRAALSRQLDRTLAQRLGLDLILVALAAVALWQLASYGSPLTTTVRGDLGIDPLLVAAPAIGLLAGALVATRLVPRLAELGERAVERASGLAATFLARQMSRRPLRYTRVALLLMLAVALGTFAAAFAATWSNSQGEQAAYQSGGDIRAIVSDRPVAPAWTLPALYQAVPGVRAVASVGRGTFDVGRDLTSGQLLTVAPAALGTSSFEVSGTENLASQAAALSRGGVDGSVAIPDGATELAVTLATDVSLEYDGNGDPPDLTQGTVASVSLTVAVSNSAGVWVLDSEGSVACRQGVATTTTIAIPMAGFAGPARLTGVELTLSGTISGTLTGTVEITGVGARGGGSGSERVPLASIPSGSWSWRQNIYGHDQAYSSPEAHPGLIGLGPNLSQALVHFDIYNPADTVLRYVADADTAPIPVIANQQLLDATGTRVGDTILISRGGYESRVKIESIAALFPTLDPSRPFLVVDTGKLARYDYEASDLRTTSKELWLRIAPGSEESVAAALGGGAYSVSSIASRLDLERSGRADPIALGVIGALFLGSIAAVLLAAIGFLFNAAFMARERNGELAVLRALGERPATLTRMLAVEQSFLLAYGLIAGVALGVLLGWLAIPFAWLTPAGTVPVPSPGIVVPWFELGAVGLPIAIALFACAVALIRSTNRDSAATALRRQDVAP